MERVPQEIDRMLKKACKDLEGEVLDGFDDVEIEVKDNKNFIQGVAQIDRLRKGLMEVDHQLRECQGILHDYIQVMLQEQVSNLGNEDQLSLDFGSEVEIETGDDGELKISQPKEANSEDG
tara:strand:+ start:369 stop:731 length:363 start_codon:yes stop_codon:yes gene_type:complete